jgi:hypothetical protein
MAEMTFTATQKLEAVNREIAFRRRVYDRKVTEGRMTKQKADFEIAIMEEIATDYRALAEKERLL